MLNNIINKITHKDMLKKYWQCNVNGEGRGFQVYLFFADKTLSIFLHKYNFCCMWWYQRNFVCGHQEIMPFPHNDLGMLR